LSMNDSHDFFIQWHLTDRCNLRCRHCYQQGGTADEMSLSEIGSVAGEVEETLKIWADAYDISFTPSFNITGGEPFLRKDIFEILAELTERGFEIYLLSNGTLIDGKKARRLSELATKGVQISMEGPEHIHDAIRGRGSYSASVKGISRLLDAGVKVTMNVTLSGLNVAFFRELVALASSLGVQRLGFSRLVPSGRGAGLLNSMLGKEDVRSAYAEIFSLSAGQVEIVTGDPVAAQMSVPPGEGDAGGFPGGGCAAGVSGLTFLPDGTIIPCRRLHVPVGNILKDSLREVWATSGVLEALRDRKRYGGKCGTCSRWADCRGCRAIAYAYSQSGGGEDFLCEDPQCFIRD
jgi:MoaA/NifB/PqqE/SkfB family radical SAM enzyme